MQTNNNQLMHDANLSQLKGIAPHNPFVLFSAPEIEAAHGMHPVVRRALAHGAAASCGTSNGFSVQPLRMLADDDDKRRGTSDDDPGRRPKPADDPAKRPKPADDPAKRPKPADDDDKRRRRADDDDKRR
jgi:hypothetical protein